MVLTFDGIVRLWIVSIIWLVVSVQVWHGIDGSKQYMFTGHEAPVYCVCPQYRDNIHVCIC